MSDLDVSLRLRLVNQLSKPAEEAERDLKELGDAAKRLGAARGGDQLAGDLDKIKRQAGAAKSELSEVDRVARQLGWGGSGFDALIKDADRAGRGIREIGTAAETAKQKLGLLDNGAALDKVKTDADAAASAVRDIGAAADRSQTKLNQMHTAGQRYSGQGAVPPPDGRDRRRISGDMAEGLADNAGVDAIMPVGVGIAYGTGALIGTGVLGAGKAFASYAEQDRALGYVMRNMDTPESEREGVKARLRDIASETKAPYADVISGFEALGATGRNWKESLDLLPVVVRTALASNSAPEGVANTVHDLRSKMGIAPEDIPYALDMMVGGGQRGRFEGDDMSKYAPVVLPFATNAGYTGLEGWAKIVAMLQTVMENAPDPSSAASYLSDLLFKYNAPETKRNFKDVGIDWESERRAGRERGEDSLTTFMATLDKATGGNPERINEFLGDKQVFQAGLAIKNNQEKIAADREFVLGSRGLVDSIWKEVSGDAKASIDAVNNSLGRVQVGGGSVVDQLGGSWLMNTVARRLEEGARQPIGALMSVAGMTDPVQSMANLAREWFAGSDLAKRLGVAGGGDRAQNLMKGQPIVVPTGDWRAPAYEPPRTKGGVSDVRPMPSGPIAAAITGRVESELSTDMSAAAQASMEGYNAELQAQGDKALVMVQSFVQQLKAQLSFTASPVIAPVVTAPSVGGAATSVPEVTGKQSSAEPAGGKPVKVTQNIYSPNSRLAARAAVKEQNRSVRLAQANALHDLGSRV